MTDFRHEVDAGRWAALIKERTDSGMTIREWCREKNIKESQYYYWLKILRRDESATAQRDSGVMPFVELPAVCQGRGEAHGRAAAVIRKGDIFIEITDSVSAGFIAKILEAVSHAR